MEDGIIVVDADRAQCARLCALLRKGKHSVVPLHSVGSLETILQGQDSRFVFIDFDTIPIDNQHVKQLAGAHPCVHFFGLSKKAFHPDLRDAIGSHLYACIRKPIDPDELFYWLRSVEEDAD